MKLIETKGGDSKGKAQSEDTIQRRFVELNLAEDKPLRKRPPAVKITIHVRK